jgi:hypothetical protein
LLVCLEWSTAVFLTPKSFSMRCITCILMVLLLAAPLAGQDAAPEQPASTPQPAATPAPAATPEVVVIQGERPTQETPEGQAPVTPVEGETPQTPGEGEQPGQTPGTPRVQRTPPPSSFSGEFSFSTNPDNLMLRLTPERQPESQDLTVLEGDVFVTDIVLSNRRRTPVNGIRIVLDYNPAYVTPQKLNDGQLADRISGRPRLTVNRDRGQIIYEAILGDPIIEPDDALMFIEWKALQPVLFTPIVFGRDRDGRATELFENSQGVLGELWQEGDGTLSIGVMIVPSDPTEAELMRQEPLLYTGSNERIGGVRLELVGPPEPPRVGEVFTIDVVLDNRVHSMLDGVSFIIQYDPDVLEIFDHDFDNWITIGHNIHDGSFRHQFPWDYHMANSVMAMRGTIEYRVGTSIPDDFLGVHGVMAQIVARAKKPTAGTPLRFLFSRRPGQRTTEAVYLGQDVLGEPDIVNDGVRATVVTVLP